MAQSPTASKTTPRRSPVMKPEGPELPSALRQPNSGGHYLRDLQGRLVPAHLGEQSKKAPKARPLTSKGSKARTHTPKQTRKGVAEDG